MNEATPPEDAARGDMGIVVRTIPRHYTALGIAVHYLGRRQPFSMFRFGDAVRTVDGQIRRGHCRFALQGERVVGYCGWALYDTAAAEAFARTGRPPADAFANGGDVVWLLTVAAESAAALRALLAAGRALYPGWRVMGVRHRSNGRVVVFDQPYRPRSRRASA